MQDPKAKVSLIGSCVLCALAGIALLRYFVGDRTIGLVRQRPPTQSYQADLILQEAAFPGKVVRAAQQGVEVLRYVCGPQDAATALVVVRDRKTGFPTVPHIVVARDGSGRTYSVKLQASRDVFMIALQHGYAKRPPWVAITLEMGPISDNMPRCEVRMTKIAESLRTLDTPSAKFGDATAKLVRAVFDSSRGQFKIRYAGRVPPGETVEPRLLATSFGCGDRLWPRLPYLSFDFSPDDGRDVGALRVELDRLRYENSDTTLSYRNATLFEAAGQRYLEFPSRQMIGGVIDYDAWLGPTQFMGVPFVSRRNRKLQGQMTIRLLPRHTPNASLDEQTKRYPLAPIVSLASVVPDPDSIGFESVRVRLLEPTAMGAADGGFDQAVTATVPPTTKAPTIVPRIDIRVHIRKPILVSATTVVVPVTRS